MSANRKYNRFSRGGCFNCRMCLKLTRDVGSGNSSAQLCKLCQWKAEHGNSLSDAGYSGDAWEVFEKCKTVKEVEELLASELAKLQGVSNGHQD